MVKLKNRDFWRGDDLVMNILNEFEVYCTHKNRGCDKVMRIRELEIHELECSYKNKPVI